MVKTRSYRETEEKYQVETEKLMKVLELGHRKGTLAGALPYGDQKKLEIARALATGAKILILDEPAAGMNPEEGNGSLSNSLPVRSPWRRRR